MKDKEKDDHVRGGVMTIGDDDEKIVNMKLCEPVSGGVSAGSVKNNANAQKCLFTRKGVCQVHQVPGKKLTIPSKVWKDRGGGSWVWICD